MGMAPKNHQACSNEDIRARMEKTIEQGVDPQVLDGVWGEASACHHVMPLQDLVQDDAVKEAAEPKAEKYPRRCWKVPLLLLAAHYDPFLYRFLALGIWCARPDSALRSVPGVQGLLKQGTRLPPEPTCKL